MTERDVSGRRPFEYVELVQDLCDKEFGVTCDADLSVTGQECFNTRLTCQDAANYNLTSEGLTLRFCSDQQSIPQDGNYWFPFLKTVKVKPAKINPGGGDRSSKALGMRSTITVQLDDRPHTDRIVDPYLDLRKARIPTYDPLSFESSFWQRWRARNPYYLNRVIRHVSGYIRDGQVVDSVTRTFIITGFKSTRNGVTFQGKDILSLTADVKAQAPLASEGSLLAAINDTDTAITLVPAGVGNEAYPTSGLARINNELVTFSRSGDAVTIVRGVGGTTATGHSDGDTFQLCLQYTSQQAKDILYDLLVNYANIDPSYIDTAQWDAESLTYLTRLYSAIITEATSVAGLVAEICEQMFCYLTYDEREAKIKLFAVRPSDGEGVTQLTDDRNIIADSLDIQDLTDQVVTKVVVHYALRDPTQNLDEESNYAATEVITDPTAGGVTKLRGERTKTIFSRWIGKTDAAAAIELGEKLLARYKNIPVQVTFGVDAKDRDLWVGDFVSIDTYRSVTPQGDIRQPLNIQIFEANEAQLGSSFTYKGQSFVYEDPPDPTDKSIVIVGENFNVNFRDVYDSQRVDPPLAGDNVVITVRTGATLGSTSSGAFNWGTRVGSWPAGVNLTLNIEPGAFIVGGGGIGGEGRNWLGAEAEDGQPGGNALLVDYDITINNLGVIGGGGGGGGGGADALGGGGGGGGGAGYRGGVGGDAGAAASAPFDGQDGGDGGLEDGGIGGRNGTSATGRAGDGGDLGQPGTAGSGGLGGVPGSGGAAGNAVDVASATVTWINKGDIRGDDNS